MKIAGGRSLSHAPIGLSIGLEQSVLLVWDRTGGVKLFNQAGEVQASAQFAGIVQGSLSADGTTPAILLSNGTLLLLRQDLSVRLEIAAGATSRAVAIDNHGHHVAISHSSGDLCFWSGLGQQGKRLELPRPAIHLAFAVEHPWLAFTAESGLAGCADINGLVRWREGLAHNLGPISIAGGSGHWFVPCFSGGLIKFGPLGPPHVSIKGIPMCRIVAANHTGSRLFLVGHHGDISLIDDTGKPISSITIPTAITCMAADPLGRFAILGLEDKRILWVHPPS
jgi:hypothetical protein